MNWMPTPWAKEKMLMGRVSSGHFLSALQGLFTSWPRKNGLGISGVKKNCMMCQVVTGYLYIHVKTSRSRHSYSCLRIEFTSVCVHSLSSTD